MKTHAVFLVALVLAGSCAGMLGTGCSSEDDDEREPPPEVAYAFGSGSSDPGIYYRVRSVQTGQCANVTGSSSANRATIGQVTCGSGRSQRWYLRALSATTYQLSVQHSARCMRVSSGSTSNGAAVVQDVCARTGSGLGGTVFTVQPVGSASPTQYQLISTSGKCVDGNSTTSLVQNPCSTAARFLWTLDPVAAVAPSDANGRWSAVIGTMGMVPASGAVLPDRKVLLWASWTGTQFAGTGALDQTVTLLFDPDNPSASVLRTITSTAHNMFCPGTSVLADGRILVSGGDDSRTDATSIYSPATDSWTRGAVMRQARWYNSNVTLPGGQVLTMGGNRTSGLSGNGEIYDPVANTWTAKDSILGSALTAGTDPVLSRTMEHPRLFVAPDGRVFVPGPTPHMQWISVAGSGSITAAGDRGDDETSQNDVTVMYDIGKLLKAGGNISYDRSNPGFVPSSQSAYRIDITTATAAVTKIAPMIYPRAFANGVVLPTGEVFVAGGLDNGRGFSDDGAIKAGEMFDPATSTWRELPAMATPRPYHSLALLLTDGRVLVGGGGLCSGSCSVNHPNVEIYSPPYMFAAGRPSITSAPSTITANGGTFSVNVSGTITGFSLIRMDSATHSVHTDPRRVPLVSTGGGASFTVTAPANRNIAPPGPYMLFALNGNVPSVAAVVTVH